MILRMNNFAMLSYFYCATLYFASKYNRNTSRPNQTLWFASILIEKLAFFFRQSATSSTIRKD